MTLSSLRARCFVPALLAAALLLPAAHAAARTASELDAMYQAAVEDARIAEPSEICTTLTPLTAENPSLIWEGTPGASRVLVTTWTSASYYDGSVGQEYVLPAFAEVWVTVVPEIKSWFGARGISPADVTTLRLEQLLGLPPGGGKSKFVELWVSPDDLFRPTPDPDISDTTAELSYPRGRYTNVPSEYRDWFEARSAQIYDDPAPYPWTRLGYTYDWGDPTREVGLSEFVIKGGAQLKVHAITPTSGYFSQTPAAVLVNLLDSPEQ